MTSNAILPEDWLNNVCEDLHFLDVPKSFFRLPISKKCQKRLGGITNEIVATVRKRATKMTGNYQHYEGREEADAIELLQVQPIQETDKRAGCCSSDPGPLV